jgi:integrase
MATVTGARPGELCAARWEDWRPNVIRDALGHGWSILEVDHKNRRWTDGRKRKIIVPPALTRAIERMRAREGRHPTHLWAHRRGRGAETRGAVSPELGEPWKRHALDQRVRKWREAAIQAAAAGDRLAALVPPDVVLYCLRHGYYSRVAPVLGALTAGQLGGTNNAQVVERRYVHSQDAQLLGAAVASRRAGRAASE